MIWRRHVLQGFVITAVALLACGYWCYRSWTDSASVRQSVLELLASEFPDVQVQLGEAQFQLFGGVRLQDLRLTRRSDSTGEPFASFAEVIIHPDREQLARGVLVIRKVELIRPRITVVRDVDGRLNVAALQQKQTSRQPPIVLIQNGTFTYVDHALGAPPVEFQELHGTLAPIDPVVLRAELSGKSAMLGELSVSGTVDPDTGEFDASYNLAKVRLGPSVHDLVAALWPESRPFVRLEGDLEIEGELAYHPGASQPWASTLHADLRNGRYEHEELPFPLEQLHFVAQAQGCRLVIEHLVAQAGDASLEGSAEFQSLAAASDYRIRLKLDRLTVDDRLIARLPPRMQSTVEDFGPVGKLSASVEISRSDGRTTVACTVRPLGMSATYAEFPYRVDGITGSLQYSDAGRTPIIKVQLDGLADGQPVRLTGDVHGEGLRPACPLRPGFNLEIHGTRVPITPRLLKALELYPRTFETVAEFKPAGAVTMVVNLQRRPGESPEEKPPLDKRFVFHFHDASMRYQEFPYPVEEIEGTLEISADESWRFYDFRGKHKGGEFQGAGRGVPSPAGNRIRLLIHGRNVLLDHEMEAALDAEMHAAWQLFNPSGRVDFTAQIDCVGKGRPALDLRASARNCRMKPSCFPYQMNEVKGDFHYVDDRVTITNFQASHDESIISLKQADVTLRCNGGYRADLHQLHAENLLVNEEFLQALPSMVRKAFATLQPDRPIRIVTDLVIIENRQGTQYHWDGSVAFGGATLQCGLEATNATGLVALRGWYDGDKLNAEGNVQLSEVTVARLPLRNLRSTIKVTDEALLLAGIEASVHGGQLYGPVRVNFAAEPEYHVDLTASQLDLETFARETLERSGQVKGKASARLRLQGRGSDLRSLRGEGAIHIEDGARIYDLPLVLNLLTTLSGHLPKGSAFQEAHADLVITGDTIKVPQVELLGDALSLRGQGDLRVDGSRLNLEMYGLLWGRTLPLLPPLIDRIPVEVSRQLMKIRIQGSLGDVEVKREPVPIIVEPVRELWRKMADRISAEEGRKDRRLP